MWLGWKYVAHGHSPSVQYIIILHNIVRYCLGIVQQYGVYAIYSRLVFRCQYIRMSFVLFYAKYAIFIVSNWAINNKRSLLLSSSISLSPSPSSVWSLIPKLPLFGCYYLNDVCTCRLFHLLLAPPRIYIQYDTQSQMNSIYLCCMSHQSH